MVTKLELIRRAIRETGLGFGDEITTSLNLSGHYKLVAEWVDASWESIQNDYPDIGFLKVLRRAFFTTPGGDDEGKFSFPHTDAQFLSGTPDLTTDDINLWDLDSARAYFTDDGRDDEYDLRPISYELWYDSWQRGSLSTTPSQPLEIAVSRDDPRHLLIGPNTAAGYTVTVDFWRTPHVMTSDTDEPRGLESRYHLVIVDRVLWEYGGFDAAPEAVLRAQSSYESRMAQIRNRWLPRLTL